MKLIRHSLYNLLGLGLPLLVAVLSIPVLIRELGDARFGMLTLIWSVVSYFGLFDLGLGRALTQKLTVEFSGEDHSEVRSLVATSIALMAILGVFSAILMAGLASWGVGLIQDVPNQKEAIRAFYWMAVAMPAIVLTSGFRGILEARYQFAIVNLIRFPMGLFTFLGPLFMVLAGVVQLDAIALVLAAGRIVACVVHGWYAWRLLPSKLGSFTIKRNMMKPLCISGGLMTVSNVVGPIMGYLDRFVVGGLVSAEAVAFYSTPQEITSRLSILPAALMSVVFPKFSEINLDLNGKGVAFVDITTSLLFYVCLPVFATLSIFSHEILTLWISLDFSKNASSVLSIMACGMLINCISVVPLNWLQATDRSKRVAAIHLIELPLFCALLWFGIQEWGIKGAACAWLIRIVLDACFLWLTLASEEFLMKALAKRYLLRSLAITTIIYFMSLTYFSLEIRSIFLSVVIVGCIVKFIKMLNIKFNN